MTVYLIFKYGIYVSVGWQIDARHGKANPPAKAKRLLLKYFKKRATTTLYTVVAHFMG